MFIVLEMQTNDGVTTVVEPIFTTADRKTAEQKYHTILSYAAVSGLDLHTAVLLLDNGRTVKTQCYSNKEDEYVPG